MNQLKEKLIQIVTRKRVDEEKGHYSYMRKNKKNLGPMKKIERDSQGSLPKSIKALKLYE